jgi:hypothetical protein
VQHTATEIMKLILKLVEAKFIMMCLKILLLI